MKLTLKFASFLYLWCYIVPGAETAFDYNQPILPKTYSRKLGFGFSTNWFKSEGKLSKIYEEYYVKDVYVAGFRNLRLRCRADVLNAPYTDDKSIQYFKDLEKVVDDCLNNRVYPVISWIHHHAEAFASKQDEENYMTWWKKVAEMLMNKDYRLSFNLFTEIGIDECQKTNNCSYSLKMDIDKFNRWTSRVVNIIRKTGGNNADRIIILTSPKRTEKGLKLIDKTIYENDNYMMVEWHTYAAGPSKTRENGPRDWDGNGTDVQRQNLLEQIERAKEEITLKGYYGAWMTYDNKDGTLTQEEAENFARYFVSVMKAEKMPSSLNVLDVFYNVTGGGWRTDSDEIQGQAIDRARIIKVIRETIGA